MSFENTAVALWRPVGPKELDLIRQSGMRAFPPRLPEQPIFYSVLTEAYAVKIARNWNVPASGKGYVTRFLQGFPGSLSSPGGRRRAQETFGPSMQPSLERSRWWAAFLSFITRKVEVRLRLLRQVRTFGLSRSSGPRRPPCEPIGASIATIGSIHQDREQRMSTDERTAPATAVCLVLVVAALGLFIANFEWPTSRMVREGISIRENDILVYDVLPLIATGFVIGLGAIAITRFIFPRSSIKVVLYVVGACAGLAALPLLWLSAAIGARNIRDLGTIAMLIAVPLAIAMWAAISSYRTKQEGR